MADSENFPQLALEVGRVFSPAAPIDERALFAGRRRQLRAVIDAISQRGQHAIIYGERGVGKTSLGNVLSEFLTGAQRLVLAPRINCDSKDDFGSLWRKILSEIQISREVRGIGFAAENRLEAENLADRLPQNVTPDDVRKVLTLLGRSALLIIIIDEFDRLPKGPTSALFADMIKTLSDHSVSATLVLVGVGDSVDQLIAEHESVERALVQIPMPRMSKDELHEIINRGLERLSMEIDVDALDQILLLSQGLPHYTHLLGLHAAREALDADTRQIAQPHVDQAIHMALDQAQQSIRNAYHKATTSPRKESLHRHVLLACSFTITDDLGYFSPAAVREPMSLIMGKRYDIPSFSRHLREFASERRGPIFRKSGVKHRTRYRFINPLMQPHITLRGIADKLVDQSTLRELWRRQL